MKKKYMAPKVQVCSLEENTCLLAGSTKVTVSNESGNFDSDGSGGYVVNSRPGRSLWDEE